MAVARFLSTGIDARVRPMLHQWDDGRASRVRNGVEMGVNPFPSYGRQAGPALDMFEVFGRTGPQNSRGGRNFGP